MNIDEVKKARDSLIQIVNENFDRLIVRLENPDLICEPIEYERILPLTTDPSKFIGKKPKAVLFGEERVEVKTWCKVYEIILKRCNEDPKHHKMLMYLRNKVAGKCRVFLSDKPDRMSKPLRIDDDLYGEIHYGSATLAHILVNHILTPVGFDCSGISVVLKG